jgi:glycosyltransferase involved in cell wall biosynthesis
MGAPDVWLCVITKGRLALTRQCIASLQEQRSPRLRLIAVDAGSTDGTPGYLEELKGQGVLQALLLNPPGSLPQWQKNAAIEQFARFLGQRAYAYAGWVDNDVVLKGGWLEAAFECFESGPGRVEVVSLFSDAEQERVHPTVEELSVGSHRLRLKRSANGAAWLFRRGFFERHGPPPVGAGITEASVEDWHYSRVLHSKGLLFGVLEGYAEHIGAADSARLAAQQRLYGASRALGGRTIAIDARTVEPHMHGIGVYAHALVTHLPRLAPAARFVVLHCAEGRELFRGAPPNVTLEPCPAALGDATWETDGGPRWCRENDVDLYHGTSYGAIVSESVAALATVHDVSFATLPQFYPGGFVRHMMAELERTLRTADHVVAVSEYVAQQLVNRFRLAGGRVVAIHSGPGQFDGPADLRRPREHILTFDMGQRRKNTKRVIEAFAALLHRTGFTGSLKVVERGWEVESELRRLCQELGIADRVEVTGEVTRSDLAELYAGALCLAYPSLDEGFGFPPLEAMQFGTPVIASRAGGLPEVCADAPLYVDPASTDEIGAAMARLVTDDGLREDLGRRGRRRAAQFSWERCARETMAVYSAFLGKRQGTMRVFARAPAPGAVAMVTTWNVPCGVARSTRSLIQSLRDLRRVRVLSERGTAAEPGGVAVWQRPADLEDIPRAASEQRCSLVHVQYHPAFFHDGDAFCKLLWDLKLSGLGTIVTLHELTGRPPVWALVPDLLLVHSGLMRDHLRRGGITTPCLVAPLALPSRPQTAGSGLPAGRAILKTVGFLHPNRGHRWGLDVLAALKDRFDVEYHVAGAVAQGCDGYPEELRSRARRLGVAGRFRLRAAYVPDDELLAEWQCATVALLPYEYIGLGSSGAVLDALAADVPVLTSTSPFFDGLGNAVGQCEDPAHMAERVAELLTDEAGGERMAEARRALAAARDPKLRAEQHERGYRQVQARLARVRRHALDAWISLHIIAKERTGLGLALFRSCLQSLRGYPDEFVIVDNGCSPEVRDMVGEQLRGEDVKVIAAPEVADYASLRNAALERTAREATHIHWVDTDEVFFPSQLPKLREALRDPDITMMHVLLVHFMREPTLIQDTQVNRCIFRMGRSLRWRGSVHEVPEGLPAGRHSFFPVRFLHFGYVRPQWETCLKWLKYAQLEHGGLARYKWERVEDGERPWFGDHRSPDTILDDRATHPYDGIYPSSCADWLEAWHRSGEPWADHLRRLVDHSFWDRWQEMREERGSWEGTLDDILALAQRPDVRLSV